MMTFIAALCCLLLIVKVGSFSWISAEGSYLQYEEDFSSEVSADGIVYTSVRIPANSLLVNISIWAVQLDFVEDINAYALLRYDGVPTPHHYDAKYEIPDIPQQLSIVDLQPTASVLYIGIWGGKLLHSYRFFAGSPVFIPVGVRASIASCASSALQAPLCLPLPALPSSLTHPTSYLQSDLAYQVNKSVSFSWSVPSYIEEARVEVRLASNSAMQTLCSHLLHPLPLTIEAYLDQPLEDENYARMVYSLHMESLCGVGGGGANLHLSLAYPLPGSWTVRLSLAAPMNKAASSGDDTLSFSITSTMKMVAKLQMSPTHRNESIVVLKATADDASSVGYLHFSSTMLPFSGIVDASSNQQPVYKMDFVAYLESHRSSIMVGGAVEVQLKIRLPASSVPDKDAFWTRVLLRLGNLPMEESSITSAPSSTGNYSLLSLNALHLHSGVDVISGSNTMKRKGIEFVDFVYTWTIMKPLLPQLEDHLSDRMYISVQFPLPAMPQNIQQVKVSLGVLFTPCPANACVHGICYIKRGDVMASMCLCKYPWAGERCDSLSVSDEMYLVQILALVLSNAAMLPGVLYCMFQGLQIISAGLFTAATASAFYHLCDTDAYCIMGLSFQSLQVLDVLFCTAMMAIVLLLYAPISRHIHSALSVLVIGLMVSPVAYDPTNPWNVVFTLSFAFVVVGVTWVVWRYRGQLTLLGESVIANMDKIIYAKDRATSLQNTAYSSLSQNESMIDASTSTTEIAVGVDEEEAGEGIELGAIHRTAQINNEESSIKTSKVAKTSLVTLLYYARTGMVGGVLGVVGLLFFANQTRENYWYTHSLWHIFVMLASYLLVKGRNELFHSLHIVDLFGKKANSQTSA